MQFKLYAIVAVGGGIGTVARFFITEKCRSWSEVFPYGVFVVNMLGSLAIGLLAGWIVLRPSMPESLRVFLMLGLLGGFTTFSSFSYDTLTLMKAGLYGYAFTNMIVQVLGGLLLVAIGFYLSRAIFH